MVGGRGSRFIPPSCHSSGWLVPCLMVNWSSVVSFTGTSIPKGSSRVRACACARARVCVCVFEFLGCMGTCPFFPLLNIMMRSCPVFSRNFFGRVVD